MVCSKDEGEDGNRCFRTIPGLYSGRFFGKEGVGGRKKICLDITTFWWNLGDLLRMAVLLEHCVSDSPHWFPSCKLQINIGSIDDLHKGLNGRLDERSV